MGMRIKDLLPSNFSQTTTAYTLALSTKVPNADNTRLQDLFVILGRIQSFGPNQSRNLEKVFEINTASGGEAVEIVPGGIPTDEISIDRIDIYPVPFLNAFGGLEANNLRSQNYPFTIHQYVFDPKDIKRSMEIQYINCYVADFSDPIDISDGGGGPVAVSGTVQVSYRRAKPMFGDDVANGNEQPNIQATTWLSFKQTPGKTGAGYQEHRLNDLGLTQDFVILNRESLVTLANVCVDNTTAN